MCAAAGRTTPELLREVEAALQAAAVQVSASCGRGEGAPPTIAYAHYPLSTLDHQPGASPGPAFAHYAQQSVHSMQVRRPGRNDGAAKSEPLLRGGAPLPPQGLAALLARHNVSAFLAGHLHSSFGPRLHRIHAAPGGGAMAELEAAAWKDDRRFRVLALDGAAFSFADLYFHAPGSPPRPRRADAPAAADPEWREARARRGWAVTAADPSCRVVHHVVLLTSPPDARYASLGPPRQAGGAGYASGGAVRALVLPLGDSREPAEVSLHVELPGGAEVHRQGMVLLAGQAEAGAAAGGGRLLAYGTQVEILLPCGKPAAVGQGGGGCGPPAGLVRLQVVAGERGAPGHSTSAWQPAGLLCQAEPGGTRQRCTVVAASERAPLGVSFLEWLILAYNWPVIIPRCAQGAVGWLAAVACCSRADAARGSAACRLFLGVWAVQFGLLLLLPRLLGRHLSRSVQGSPLFSHNSFHLLRCVGEAGATRWAAAALREAFAYLTWPLAALVLASTVDSVWVPMVSRQLATWAGVKRVADQIVWARLFFTLTLWLLSLQCFAGFVQPVPSGGAVGGRCSAGRLAPRPHPPLWRLRQI